MTQKIEIPPGYVGIVENFPEKEYHQLPSLGSTSIKTLSDPEISLFEAKYLMDRDEHKRVYDIGTLAHALILEGSLDHLVSHIPFDSYRTNAAKEAKAVAYDAGLIPVNESEYETMLGPVEAMRDAVFAHDTARDLLTGHQPEVSVFWEQAQVPMKARIDALHKNRKLAVDLKSTRSARPNDFRKQGSDLGYYIQAQHYLNGLKEATGDDYDWLFVAVQNTEPYVVSVHRVTRDALIEGAVRIGHAIDRYKTGLEHGWTGYNQIFDLELTPWESMKNETLLDDEIFIGGAA